MKRLLIANRGEVVLRVLRTAKEMGLETIAVYSEADANMEYLSYADEAVQIGPAQPSKSYLNIEAIISAAVGWKANAIHPGYGFLSENPNFAAICEQNGIAFIGPSSATLRTIGNKSRTKEVAQSLGIPTIPG
ncbi:MAG TPA: biotin carboxylase N-terminal domain-containing protein, partial [Deltaproteobacteria bacterium]|nr:biotin carboxylase N-terminal domain-containing protein [Deltaproteobacteria bacterium]